MAYPLSAARGRVRQKHHRFTPSELSGLQGWYRADAGVTTVSGAVSQWNDQSGNAHHWSQATSANRPGYATNQINGLPAITFASSLSQWMGTTGIGLSGDFHIFAVVKLTTNGTTRVLLGDRNPDPGGYYIMNADDTTGRVNFQDGNAPSSTMHLPNGVWTVIEIDRSGTDVQFYRDGWPLNTSPFPQSAGNAITVANLGAHADDGSGPFNGGVLEIIVLNRSLAEYGTDRLNVLSYLKDRTNILGLSRPYRAWTSAQGIYPYWMNPGTLKVGNRVLLSASANSPSQLSPGVGCIGYSDDGGRTWTNPVVAWEGGTGPSGNYQGDGNPIPSGYWVKVSLGIGGLSNGDILQSLLVQSGSDIAWGPTPVSRSTNGGTVWDAPANWVVINPPNGQQAWAQYGRPVEDPARPGTVYLTGHGGPADGNTTDVFVFKSTDFGHTWDGGTVATDHSTLGYNPVEPTLAIRQDGTLVIVFRVDASGSNGLWQIESTDHGATWSNPVNLPVMGAVAGYNVGGPELMILEGGHWVLRTRASITWSILTGGVSAV